MSAARSAAGATSRINAGIDRAGVSAIDLIAAHKDLKLVALFAAEHGMRGDRGPTPAMLEHLDVLVYDLPEVGGRTWTEVSTTASSGLNHCWDVRRPT